MSADLFDHAGVLAPPKGKTDADRPKPRADIAPGQVIGVGTGGDLWNPAFDAAGLTRPDTVNWWPTRSSGDGTTLPAKDLTLARVRDIVRNDPTARAALERFVDLIVGPGLYLSAIPDGTALGITDKKELRNFARSIESEWRLFSNDPRRLCDAQRRLSMNGLFRLFARTWFTCGEATYANMWRDASERRYATCVMAIDPDRLCNPNGMYETLTLRGGVEMDTFGAPIAYHVRNAHIGDWWAAVEAWTWTRVPKATSWGRPIFVHAFEPEREGQTRAMSPFAALLTRLKMIGKFADAELASAALNALFSAFVETDLPVDEVQKTLAPNSAIYADKVIEHFTRHPATVAGVRIPVYPPGSKITMNSNPRQTSSFAAFQTAFLQSIAAALPGLSYETLSMDFTKSNYSSIRAALNETWRSVKRISRVFAEQVVTPIYYAFLEEAFDKGYLELPAGAAPLTVGSRFDALDVFHQMPGAFMRARWIGPGRGYVDALKEAEASGLRMESLVSSLEKECAEQGDSVEEMLDQIAIEEAMLKERGLTRLSIVAAVQSTRGPKPDSEEARGPAGPDDDARGQQAPS